MVWCSTDFSTGRAPILLRRFRMNKHIFLQWLFRIYRQVLKHFFSFRVKCGVKLARAKVKNLCYTIIHSWDIVFTRIQKVPKTCFFFTFWYSVLQEYDMLEHFRFRIRNLRNESYWNYMILLVSQNWCQGSVFDYCILFRSPSLFWIVLSSDLQTELFKSWSKFCSISTLWTVIYSEFRVQFDLIVFGISKLNISNLEPCSYVNSVPFGHYQLSAWDHVGAPIRRRAVFESAVVRR